MKSPTSGMAALLSSGKPLFLADLYKISPVLGAPIYLCSADLPVVTVESETYLPGPPHLSRDGIRITRGVQVGELNIELVDDGSTTLNGITWLQALRTGALDGAALTLKKGVIDGTLADPFASLAETVILFSGRISDMEPHRNSAKILVRADTELLNIAMPRNLYQPPCVNTLYGNACGAVRASFSSSTTAASGSTTTSLHLNSLAQASDYFKQGVVTCVSGANAGLTRTVKAHTSGSPATVTLSYPLPYAPAPGDNFTIVPGCDHTQSTCSGKFSNGARFRGFPYIPVPEAAL